MRFALAILIGLLLAAPAHAAPRPLLELGEDEQVALAGDRVLFTHMRASSLEVRALPLAMTQPGGQRRIIS